METKNGVLFSPKFTESDIEILKQYFEINKRYLTKINVELMAVLSDHPLWGPLLKMQTPEQQKQQNERAQELQRAAIYEGKWDEYNNDLITQGITYARMNVSYADWYEIIKIYKVYLIPHLKKDFADSAEEAITYLDGLSKFTDYAMYAIAEAYFQEKNNIIKANEERFRAIFENSTDNISLIDKNAVVSMINHVSSRFKNEDVIGKSLLDFQSKENAEIMGKAINSVFENKTPALFDTFHTNDGKESYYSSSVSPIFSDDREVNSAVIISRDVSKQKMIEAEIKELNASLEKKVDERTEALKKANIEMESFSYSISHDLRAPLRAINGFSQILVDDHSDLMNGDVKELMNKIIANAKKMGQLIDDLLEFSRLGKQEIAKGLLDMNGLVRSIIRELETREQGRKIELNVKQLANADGDRGMLKQVMMNLISNAYKYSSKNKVSVIEIGCYKEGSDHVYYVKDNGAGFDMAYYSKLFRVFSRLHSVNEFEGTGVGLAIVHRIVAKHGGKVWAEGKVGEGATFYVSLPYLS
jgi:PAS domain S-box-containing protein